MIHLVDDALAGFLRGEVPLRDEIDVSFATPDRSWGSSITRPTVNLFLWEVVGDPSRTTLGIEERVVGDRVERRSSPPYVDLRYVVTCWATEHRDEHQLLGAVLRAVIANSSLSQRYLAEELRTKDPVGLVLGSMANRKPGEYWSSLDGQLKPSLELTVAIQVDAGGWQQAGPPVSSLVISPTPHEPVAEPKPELPGGPRRRRREGDTVLVEPAPRRKGS